MWLFVSPATRKRTFGLLTSLRDDATALTDLTNTLLTLAGTDTDSLPMQSVRLDELLWAVKEQVEKWNELYRVTITFADFPDDEAALLVLGNEAGPEESAAQPDRQRLQICR